MTYLKKSWLLFAIITTIFWGIWGAFIEIPEKAGFPATLGYTVWALTMIPCALVALYFINWKLEYNLRSIFLGSMVGLLGAGGQLILFQALRDGPAYIVFPIISLFPIVTIFLSTLVLKERASIRQWVGISMALIAVVLLSYQQPSNEGTNSNSWLLLTVLVFLMWGVQAFVMKFSNERMKAESIFFYMMITGIILIPLAIIMTDFTQKINWGYQGIYLASGIHLLNSIGALTLVYAVRYGKSIIVVPMTGLSPLITVVISLIIYAIVPDLILSLGIFTATCAIFLLSR
ncbi:MAG: EamA family transporter [Cyclobacteriaceae bacterium]